MITLSVGVPYGSWGRVRHHLRTDNASSICSQSGSCPMTNPCLLAYQSKGHILHRLLEDFCDFCQVPFSPSLSWPLHMSLRVFFFSLVAVQSQGFWLGYSPVRASSLGAWGCFPIM